MKKTAAVMLLLAAASFIIAAALYPHLPEQIASHWNASGEVDGYMSKFWGLFLFPIIILFMVVLFLIVPRIDPLKANIKKFQKYYQGFILLVVFYLLYIYALTLVWHMGIRYNMTQMITPAMGALLYGAGVLIKNAKRNWFVGIRTPWTLSSDYVWDKTHAVGARLFKASGALALLGFFFPEYAIWLVMVPVLISVVFLLVYSYLEYQKVR